MENEIKFVIVWNHQGAHINLPWLTIQIVYLFSFSIASALFYFWRKLIQYPSYATLCTEYRYDLIVTGILKECYYDEYIKILYMYISFNFHKSSSWYVDNLKQSKPRRTSLYKTVAGEKCTRLSVNISPQTGMDVEHFKLFFKSIEKTMHVIWDIMCHVNITFSSTTFEVILMF